MTRNEVIRRVKAKLEEFSPFEEPQGLLAVENNNVKPTEEYIQATLDKAFDEVLLSVPVYMIQETYEDDGVVIVNHDEDDDVWYIDRPYDFLRLHTVDCKGWRRIVNDAISTQHPLYSLQRNPNTRGYYEKPVVVINDNRIEIYSIPQQAFDSASQQYKLRKFLYVPVTVLGTSKFEDGLVEELVLMCAIKVLDIFEEFGKAKALREEYVQLIKSKTI